jgi:hypothetical protein
MPRYKYIDDFRPMAEQHPMLSFLFPSSRQITTALGALNAASIGLSTSGSVGSSLDQLENSSSVTLCLVLEDGRDPRTAIIAAIQNGWSVVAIDSELDEKWQDPRDLLPHGCSFMGFRGDMARFLSEGYELVQSSLCAIHDIKELVIICVEQGNNFDKLKSLRGRLGVTDLRVLYNNVSTTVLSVASNEIVGDCPLKSQPIHSFVDEHILASNRLVQVWSFEGSRRLLGSTASVSSSETNAKKIGPRIKSEDNVKTAVTVSSARQTRTISKVAQLQKQQELASKKRIELSSKPARPPSIAVTDDTSESSSKCELQDSKTCNHRPPKTPMKKFTTRSLTEMVPWRRATTHANERPDSLRNGCRRNTEGDDVSSSQSLLQTDSKDTIMSLMSLHIDTSEKDFPSSMDSQSAYPHPVKEVHLTGVVPPSCMPRSASERQARIHEMVSPGVCDEPIKMNKKDISDSYLSMNTESTANSSLCGDDFDPPKNHSSSSETAAMDYEPGDFVEVKVGNTYQAGTIDKQLFKGIYNVILFGDTPAWNEKRSNVDIYKYCPERMPEVMARDIRPFTPAPLGEVVYVFVNGNERKCCVQGYSYSDSKELTTRHMKYVVKFAKKDGEWRTEKHRVPVQRAYRMLCEL